MSEDIQNSGFSGGNTERTRESHADSVEFTQENEVQPAYEVLVETVENLSDIIEVNAADCRNRLVMDQPPAITFQQLAKLANIRIRKEVLRFPPNGKVLSGDILPDQMECGRTDFLIGDH